MEKGVRTSSKRTHSKIDLGTYLKEQHITREKLSELAGVSHTTVTSACRGQRIQLDKADRIAAALGKQTEEIFLLEECMDPLSNKTVKEYHRFLRMVLAQAEREMLVQFNAAAKALPPKVKRKEVNYFQPDEIAAILDALEEEPLKWRMITHLLIVTGCRRGEIMGLKWEKSIGSTGKSRLIRTCCTQKNAGSMRIPQKPKTSDTSPCRKKRWNSYASFG